MYTVISELSILFHFVYVSIFMPAPHCFVVNFETVKCESSNFVSSFSKCFVYLRPLVIHMNLRIDPPVTHTLRLPIAARQRAHRAHCDCSQATQRRDNKLGRKTKGILVFQLDSHSGKLSHWFIPHFTPKSAD